MEHIHTETSEPTTISATAAESSASSSPPPPQATRCRACPPEGDEEKRQRAFADALGDLGFGLRLAMDAVDKLCLLYDVQKPSIASSIKPVADDAEPPTDRTPPAVGTDGQGSEDDHVAPIAFRSDGVMMLHSKWLPKSERKGRPLWKGIVLSGVEAELVKNHLDSSAHEGASKLVAAMRRGK